MPQNNKPNQNNSANQQPANLSPEIIQQFVKTQYQQALNDAKELDLRGREIELNAKQAEKLLEHQAQFVKDTPSEQRKTFTTVFYIVAGFMIIILLFLGFCIYIGKDEFAYKLLQGASYVATSIISYIVGNKNRKKDNAKPSAVEEAEVVD